MVQKPKLIMPILHSVLFTNSVVQEGAKIVDSVLMNDVKVGKNVRLYKCIVVDGVKIPDGMTFGSKNSKEVLLVTKKLVSEVE